MKRIGFTLIELLVVIAIIAILAAIAFPVVMRAKDSAYRNSDIQNMNSLRSALHLYREDQGAYPPALLGYIQLYQSGPKTGQIMPVEETQQFLYPKRLSSLDDFNPQYNKQPHNLDTKAVWPNQDPRPVGSTPVLDLNGDGAIDNTDDFPCARQAFGPTDGFVQRKNPAGPGTIDAQFYKIGGYDVADVKTPTGTRTELHYALFWTKWGLASDNTCSPSGSPGSANDDPRQLGYNNPPENTIITWNPFYRDYVKGVVQHESREIVLFLDGGARPFDSGDTSDRSWRTLFK